MQFMYRIPDLANLAARKGENKDRENSFQATRNLGRFARIEKRRPDKQRQSDAGCRINLKCTTRGLTPASARLGLNVGSKTSSMDFEAFF